MGVPSLVLVFVVELIMLLAIDVFLFRFLVVPNIVYTRCVFV